MSRHPRSALIALCAAAALAAPTRAEEAKAPEPCCIDREAYPAHCRVTPAGDETCGSILSYLNTQGSTGKSYCGGNKNRGGWYAVDCKTAAEQEAKEAEEKAPAK